MLGKLNAGSEEELASAPSHSNHHPVPQITPNTPQNEAQKKSTAPKPSKIPIPSSSNNPDTNDDDDDDDSVFKVPAVDIEINIRSRSQSRERSGFSRENPRRSPRKKIPNQKR